MDNTERERLYAIIDRKQKHLEALFDSASVGMMLVDESKVVRRVNKAIKNMVRREYLQIINRPFCVSIGCAKGLCNEQGGYGGGEECQSCEFWKALEDVLNSDKFVHGIECQPTLKVGDEEITPLICINAAPVLIDGHNYAAISIEDITTRREAEKSLRESVEQKAQFIATISHELRTPLAVMKNAVSIILDGAAGRINSKQKKFLTIAKRNIDRLAVLINSVLDFQRLDTGIMRLNLQEIDLNDFLKDIYETMVLFANTNNVKLLLEFGEDHPKVRIDNEKVIRILTNLISNAIKFTPEHGKVFVSAKLQDENLIICVKDTGIGIPKEDLPKIFDRFYRVDRPGKEIQGTGLGLTIVHSIVMMYGGRIEVESEIDKGTAFIVTLPLDVESLPAASPEKTDRFLEETLVEEK